MVGSKTNYVIIQENDTNTTKCEVVKDKRNINSYWYQTKQNSSSRKYLCLIISLVSNQSLDLKIVSI